MQTQVRLRSDAMIDF